MFKKIKKASVHMICNFSFKRQDISESVVSINLLLDGHNINNYLLFYNNYLVVINNFSILTFFLTRKICKAFIYLLNRLL